LRGTPITAKTYPDHFNSNHRENTSRLAAATQVPKPEGVTVAKLWGRTCAFIGLERIGGRMIHDVTNPRAPNFVRYSETVEKSPIHF
jgi:hypothetical protein